MKTRKVFNLVTRHWVEVPDDSNFTSSIRIPISAEEFEKKNCGPNAAKVKAFSDLTPEEKKYYYEDKDEK